ncbi:restriction endonuclease [Streptococcus oricebi]|uniref:Restriction endonuclease n=1 Tax=Streptococcus oricebi TaxID=1547447 RepID=A0ABS5B4W8_9STRE|nr:restriction endonuclease [Streptococcus oricebi]MBP2623893.1 restriction endonuclease [Streptococcus oricebi]
MTEFDKMSRSEQERIMIVEIIQHLKELGGYATKNELMNSIRLANNGISEAFFDEVKISGRSGNEYHPSHYVFNFAIKNLILLGYVNKPRLANFELTDLGRKVNLSADFGKQVQFEARPLWKSVKNANNKSNGAVQEVISEMKDDKEADWRIQLSNALKAMSPEKFEEFSRALVKEMGVKIDNKIGVSYTNDGGLDGFGYITSKDDFRTNRVAIQAKRWERNIQAPEIDKFRGAMDKHNAEYGIFITTSDFSKGAVEASRLGTRVITLINGDDICDLVARYKLHVREVVTYELGDFYQSENK